MDTGQRLQDFTKERCSTTPNVWHRKTKREPKGAMEGDIAVEHEKWKEARRGLPISLRSTVVEAGYERILHCVCFPLAGVHRPPPRLSCLYAYQWVSMNAVFALMTIF